MTSKAEKEDGPTKSSERPSRLEKRHSQSPVTGEDGADKKESPKKRRKVNHGKSLAVEDCI